MVNNHPQMESKILTWHKSHSVTCPLPNTLESLLTSNASCFKLAYTELLSSLESLPFFAFAQLPSFQNVLLTWPTLICPLKPSLWYSRSSSWYPRICSSWMHPEYSWPITEFITLLYNYLHVSCPPNTVRSLGWKTN